MNRLSLWEEAIKDLQNKIDEQLSFTKWKFGQGIDKGELPETNDASWSEKHVPVKWSRKDGTAYIRKLFSLPGNIEGIKTDNSNVELDFLLPSALELYIDGTKVYSHKYWADNRATPFPLMQKVKNGAKKLIVFKTPKGDGLGEFTVRLSIDTVEDIMFELNSVLYQIRFAGILSETVNEAKHFKKHVEEALKKLHPEDVEARNWDKVLRDIKEAEEIIEVFRKHAKRLKVHLVGHAHTDMNWLWDYEDTIDICLRDFATVNKLMDRYPDLTFSQSQAHAYWIVEDHDKELFKKVRDKIKQGRWETVTSSWVEGDLNMAAGESILRHILYANKYTAEKLNTKTEAFCSLDTFGHPSTTPSLLGSAGIRYYFFLRCGKEIPLFRWKGRDGNELLAFKGYGDTIAPETLMPKFITYYGRYKISDFLFVYGVGDHGGGPTEKDIKRKRKMEQKPAIPELEFSTFQRFFNAVEKHREKLPVVTGELNTIFEGCYTTHADIKKSNRNCENLLLGLESLGAVLQMLKGKKFPETETEELWHKVMFNQFHDILDGCSIHSSYDYSAQMSSEVIGEISLQMEKHIDYLKSSEKPGEKLIVFNPLGWERTALVSIPSKNCPVHRADCIEDEDGNIVPVEKEVRNSAISFIATSLCGYGYKTFTIKKASGYDRAKRLKQAGEEYENDFYRVRIDSQTGLIRTLYDKKNRRNVLSPCFSIKEDSSSWQAETAGNLLKVSWEKPHSRSAWIIGNIYRVDHLLDAETVKTEEGILKTTLETQRRYMDSSILQRIILYPEFPFIDFENEIYWKQEGSNKDGVPMLRANFNINLKNPKVFFETPLGSVQRKNKPGEYPALRWAGFNSGKYWVALLNKDKYGYHLDGNNLSLTLLRNPYEPDGIPDSGFHTIHYRLFFGNSDILQVMKAAGEYNIPPIVTYGEGKPLTFRPFTIKGDVLPSCFKKALGRDSYILRIAEVCGKKQVVEIIFAKPFKKAYCADTAERRQKQIKGMPGNKTIKLNIAPFQTLTFDMEL